MSTLGPPTPFRLAVWLFLALGGVGLLGGVAGHVLLRSSLPELDGSARLPGLEAEVLVERDAWGTPTIRAESFLDACRAMGFVHAQDRLFQMDGLRKMGAGELASLVGQAGLAYDNEWRAYRFREIAQAQLEQMPARHLAMLEAYAEGVNAGMDSLGARTPEHLALGVTPEPWEPEDTLLVASTLYQMLSFNRSFEPCVGVMRETLPAELVEFLTPDQSRFDALMLDEGGDAPMPPLPGPDVIDLQTRAMGPAPEGESVVELVEAAPGSNNWAVAGSRTRDGRAILANDPHLALTVPGIWYRSRVVWERGPAGAGEAIGATMPGVPCVVIGSNEHVAWGFTNATADQEDYVLVEVDPEDETRYLTPDGSEPFEILDEIIEIRGEDPIRMMYRWTRWGPVMRDDWKGRPQAMKWAALDPDTVNIDLLDMMQAKSLEEAIETGRGWWGPSQNCVVADNQGRIGWVVTGYLPERFGCDGMSAVSWARGDAGWAGPIDEAGRPSVVDPESGFLFSANSRTSDTSTSRNVTRAWMLPFRSKRIRDRLAAMPVVNEDDMRLLQLDTRTEMGDWYRDLVLEVVPEDEEDALLLRARNLVANWNGTADADQSGYALLRWFRQELHTTVIQPLVLASRRADDDFWYNWPYAEEVVRRVVDSRAEHLRARQYASWEELIRDALSDSARRLDWSYGLDVRWGDLNESAIAHPISQAVPALGRFLDMPDVAQSGDWGTVRVARPTFGASLRLVVSPGRFDDGVLQTPAGQSGHPLSDHYSDHHAGWIEGDAVPLLPEEPVHALYLMPSRDRR